MTPHPKPVTHTIPAFRDFIRSKRCLISGKVGAECCHFHTRRNAGDVANCFPVLHLYHLEQHQHGIESFQRKYSLDLDAECKRLWAEWLATEEGRRWQST